MDFTEKALMGRLAGRHIGNNIHFLAEVESTNDYAFQLARRGAPEGTVVIADCQTMGKGRLNRVWQSPPACNLYTSIILKPEIDPVYAPQITLTAGVVVAELLSRFGLADITLKWPNDVQSRGKKVCGILTEMGASSNQCVDFIVVGIGININMKKADFDPSFLELSTSMKEETGKVISRLDFTAELYNHFEKWYATWLAEGFGAVRKAWFAYASMVGKRIGVVFLGDIQTGVVVGIDDYGALLLSDEAKTLKRIIAGDATVIKD